MTADDLERAAMAADDVLGPRVIDAVAVEAYALAALRVRARGISTVPAGDVLWWRRWVAATDPANG